MSEPQELLWWHPAYGVGKSGWQMWVTDVLNTLIRERNAVNEARSSRSDWIDRMQADGVDVVRPTVAPRPEPLVQVEPAAEPPGVSAEDVARMMYEGLRYPGSPVWEESDPRDRPLYRRAAAAILRALGVKP